MGALEKEAPEITRATWQREEEAEDLWVLPHGVGGGGVNVCLSIVKVTYVWAAHKRFSRVYSNPFIVWAAENPGQTPIFLVSVPQDPRKRLEPRELPWQQQWKSCQYEPSGSPPRGGVGPRIHPQEQEVLPGESCSTRRSCRLKLSRDRLSLIQQGAAERQHEALSVLINQQMEMKNSSSSNTDVAPSFQMLNFLIFFQVSVCDCSLFG